ncbi:hypothetical protein GPECTOR_52g50 [Gonium pectorale]|uniref:SGNH hydrolase-type esterase domain-containing protein n=1 Tax=Gonium pectorale TaxID=33097 RepID=A0A150G755_GONPE|nr:hypothetical protein GPECTOR_52g50 [Gonium pectorale]|eukprot:KXZ45651.1 hypothetical protein GPECTOR_52g50 [Gonium pectorale]
MADIVNRGLSGYNTRWALQALPHVFGPPGAAAAPPPPAAASVGPAPQHVLFATVWFGANDAALLSGPSHSARQHVPVEEYGKNLRQIVSHARAAGVERLVLITPPPVWEAGRKKHQIGRMGEQAADWPLDRTLEGTAPYAREAVAVAQELGTPCLDLQTLLQQEDRWGDQLLVDGLHFTPSGQEKVWQLLRELLSREWPDLSPESLPAQFPAWDAIDLANPAATFGATGAAASGADIGNTGAAPQK